MATKFFKSPLNVAVQLINLKNKLPVKNDRIAAGYLEFDIDIQPTDASKKYTANIKYRKGHHPEVYLKNQGILLNKEEVKEKMPPHCYKRVFVSKDNEYVKLCLFRPKHKEWSPEHYLSETIVPWTWEWLYFYEIWRITGNWLGGGHEIAKN